MALARMAPLISPITSGTTALSFSNDISANRWSTAMLQTRTLSSARTACFTTRSTTCRPALRAPVVAVHAKQQEQQVAPKSLAEQLSLPAAALLGAVLLLASTPDEALAARSGGRIGGSSGFSSHRSAPRPPPR